MKWANVGVGKLHHRHALRFSLLDADGRPVFSADAKSDPRDRLPGEHNLTESLRLPAKLKPGDYTLAVELADPSGQRRSFRLAMQAPEKDGRYELSRVTVK
jgi:hypothetical protein